MSREREREGEREGKRERERGPIAGLGADRLDMVAARVTGSSNNRYSPSEWTSALCCAENSWISGLIGGEI